ncbi:GntR family transcriptional repressor for pyruvate dehydrogenase complex [Halanaerobium saccharolyticum]|uniref:GntR family transcriptional repressor for pyruvate dehydrogenase complex n=1 Tax=Halanaerobium saccharolyticum TaxID=43595 RepID=A0A4R7YWZ3_9FIRM|nr:FadR/GntR family transcriptional regulator [Halanaerobium saccharolyticum]RAK06360.1 GntR family transcriptional repressor for pyruvate dehydrogenase complex [Halanaerobium saccharolyticum]TDW00672.1 GntR family transcriptional repressor for pyruvate dehydrogenase complex [Halanaerobium saccharolyticum]TDX52285.1 GntR family transcriptional repressor for pyruvate dehydrogenase complex [Halanaerobium saccharolyticum]
MDTIKKINLVDEVYKKMKEKILSGEWKPGEKIPSENELSEKFGVSRNTIRNAIQKLKGLNVIKTKQGQGTFISENLNSSIVSSIIPDMIFSNDEMLDVLEFKSVIEKENARLASIRADEDDIQEIKEALDQMIKHQDDYKEYSLWDYKFHLNIARASKNKILHQTMLRLKDILFHHLEEMNKEGDFKKSIEGHKKLYNAIKNKDPELAVNLSEEDDRERFKDLKKI